MRHEKEEGKGKENVRAPKWKSVAPGGVAWHVQKDGQRGRG